MFPSLLWAAWFAYVYGWAVVYGWLLYKFA